MTTNRRITYAGICIVLVILALRLAAQIESAAEHCDRMGGPYYAPVSTTRSTREARLNDVAPMDPKPPHMWVKTASLHDCTNKLSFDKSLLTQRDADGRTALHWASRLGRLELARLFLDHGADPNASDSEGNSPLVFLMDQRERWRDSDATSAEIADNREVMGDDPESTEELLPDEYVRTAELLIDRGADVNHRNIYNETPIYRAILGGHRNILDILIRRGADLSVRASDGKTPLDFAMHGAPKSKEIIRKLRHAAASQPARPASRPTGAGS